MKRKNWIIKTATFAILVGAISINSCKDDEEVAPTPVEVTNPLESTIYYITGIVTDQDKKTLSGVTVSTNGKTVTTNASGVYTLEVTNKSEYTVTFMKTAYLQAAEKVAIVGDKGSSVILGKILSKMAQAVKVVVSEGAIIEASKELDVEIHANALAKNEDVAITPYIPQANTKIGSANNVDISAALITINCTPSGLKFSKPITVKLKNPIETIYFDDAKHMKEVNGLWVEQGDAPFVNDSYQITMTSFSNHSIAPALKVATKSNDITIGSETIDNLGKTATATKYLNIQMKTGWEVSSFGTLPNELKNLMQDMITSTLGLSEGVKTINSTKTMAASGDTKITVTYTQTILTYSFTISFYNESPKSATVTVTTYGSDVKQTLIKGEGSMRSAHN